MSPDQAAPAPSDTEPATVESAPNLAPTARLGKPILVQPGLFIALVFPTVAAWIYFVLLRGGGAVSAAYSICKIVQFAFPMLWVRWVLREPVRLTWPTSRGIVAGLVFSGLVLLAMLSIYYGELKGSPQLAATSERLADKLQSMGIDSASKFLGLGLFVALLHSGLEEYYWRWFVFGYLRRSLPVPLALLISSVGFAGHHVIILSQYLRPEHFWTATLFLSSCVAVGGAFWAWLYQRSGSLYGPWLSHCLLDLGLFWIGYDLCRSSLAP